MKILIIGGVAGGASTAARLRRNDEEVQIILFERGEYVSYANCGLPYHIGGTISERDRLFVQTIKGFEDRFKIDVRISSEVVQINKEQKTVMVRNTATGEQYYETYDKLVISTGAEPIKPPMPGIDDARVFTLRNVPDMDRIKAFIDTHKPKQAVVVGGGFIGLEMVENLHQAGLSASVVEKANQMMAPIDYAMAAIVHQHLAQKGVQLYLQEGVKSIESIADKLSVELESGTSLPADLVILSIGVRPNVSLAQKANLEIGTLGGIKVNSFMQTSNTDIYALGDAVEVYNPIINNQILIPLAGPANKQARIVADNITLGNKYKYAGTIGTSIAKVFDITVAATGASSKLLDRFNIKHITSYTHGNAHAGYYPNSLPLDIKINFSPTDGKLFGAQVVGFDGVDKRIDILAEVIRKGGTIYDLQEIEHAYAPPFSSAKDPVNMAGFVADNILSGKMNIIHWNELASQSADSTVIIDVRTSAEHSMGSIENSINIPLDELRDHLNDIPKDKKIIVYCAVGLRGYIAYRILAQHGYTNIYNLSGGYKTHSVATQKQKVIISETKTPQMDTTNTQTVKIDACGLQCPGPIMQLKKAYDKVAPGDRLEIKVTDQAFGEDLSGWSRMMGAKVLDMQSNGGVITATVEKQLKAQAPQLQNARDNKTLVVFSADLDRAIASFVIANGAAASGKKVSIFFTFWGLNILKKENKPTIKKDFISRMFGIMMPSSTKALGLSKMNMGGLGAWMMRLIMKKKNIESLESLMTQAHDAGVEFIACSMSMDIMGIKKEELIDNITIGGVAAYLDRAEDANMNLFI